MNKYEFTEINEQVREIKFKGDITLDSSLQIKEEIKEYIQQNQIKFIVVDLEEVEFIDSSGLGMLISFFKEINEHQGQLVYIGVHDYVEKLIKLVKLDQVFIIRNSVEEALEVLKPYYA